MLLYLAQWLRSRLLARMPGSVRGNVSQRRKYAKTLTQKVFQFPEIFIIGWTKSCYFDIFRANNVVKIMAFPFPANGVNA